MFSFYLRTHRILKTLGNYLTCMVFVGAEACSTFRLQFKKIVQLCLVAQSCPTPCDPMDCSPPGSSVHEDSPGKNTGVGCQALLQGIFPTQGSNPGLLHCRWILYWSHRGSPRILERVAYPFSRGIFPTQESNKGLLHCRHILYQLSYQGSPLQQPNKVQTLSPIVPLLFIFSCQEIL